VLLQVSAGGEVLMASPQVRSNCASFNEQAVAFANDLAFRPATKGASRGVLDRAPDPPDASLNLHRQRSSRPART